ncbi:MAG TPA: penicillin-binding transpeptidase domain-containing protein [Candidatus Limnocylindrales bacterium]|nr:penicillin-binding transpeptidase domain-containing protein [Candidatus Limnocylindrales bacterium]
MPIRISNRGMSAAAALLLVFTLGACEGITLPGGGAVGGPVSILQIAQSPEDVARAFLEAWGRRDYDAMYALLSPQSQQLTGQPVFRAIYEEADAQIGLQGVTLDVGRTQEQGTSSAVSYDATIDSTFFGPIADNERLMRLVQAPAGWRVAWTPNDIFDGYSSGTSLEVVLRREPRGNILDRNGELLVEQDGTVTELYITRSTIPDEAACIDLLATLLLQQRGDLTERIAAYNFDTQFPIGDLDPETYARFSQQLSDSCAVVTGSRETRRYVGHGAAAHVTGYIGQIPIELVGSYEQRGYDASDLIGRTGIEAQYESELAGDSSRVLRVVEPGRLVVREIAQSEGRLPVDVTLTIDRDLQLAASQAMADAYNYAEGNWASREHSTGGGLVVLDVNSGAVLALSSYPTFDPGIFNPDTPIFNVGAYQIGLQNDARQPYLNRVIQNSYAAGSTFKIVTTGAAAEEGVFAPNDIFYCGRVWQGQQYGDTRTERFDWRNFEAEEGNFDTGEVNMSEALAASCNPFFYQMGALLYRDRGPGTLAQYARGMGLGGRTGIDLTDPPEVNGSLETPAGADAAISQAIGQGDTQVTILQMARMVAGVANGGTLYQPYIVQSVGVNGDAPAYEATPQVTGEMPLSDDMLAVIQDGMCMVTDSTVYGRTSGERLGTAWFVFTDPDWYPISYTVCGKTGTAQTGRIEPHGWFVAFAPADNPQIAIAGMIEHGREGSETIAPVIRRVLDAYFGVPSEQVAPFPEWWFENGYNPLQIPEGSTGV